MRTSVGRPRSGAPPPEEDGFTLIEVMIAAVVIFAALVVIAYPVTSSLATISFARQRQTATGLGNQALERARALPFDRLEQGLDATDLAGDADITVSGAEWYYGGERIPKGTVSAIPPIAPHISTYAKNGTTYTVSTYVTYYNDDPASNAMRITVVVRWSPPARGGARNSVRMQTVAFSPTSCSSTSTHPYSGPCQVMLSANAGTAAAALGVQGTLDGQTVAADLDLANATATTEVEQVAAGSARGKTSGVTRTVGGSTTTAGDQPAAASASDDPSRNLPRYSTASATQSGSDLSFTRPNASLSMQLSTGDTASSVATTAASATNTCRDAAGVSQVDDLPCSQADARQAGTQRTTLSLTPGGTAGGSAVVSELLLPATTPTAFGFAHVERATSGSTCNGDGCAIGQGRRNLGTVSIGGLPSGATAPTGWAGYLVRLSGLSDAVSATAGVGTSAPTATVAGTISAWTGSGYSSIPLTTGAGGSVSVAPASATSMVGGQTLRTDVSASVSRGGTTSTENVLAGCTTACRTSATVQSSPLTGTVSYLVTWGTTTIAAFDVQVDLGTLSAQAAYTPWS